MATYTSEIVVEHDFLDTEWWNNFLTFFNANLRLDNDPLVVNVKGTLLTVDNGSLVVGGTAKNYATGDNITVHTDNGAGLYVLSKNAVGSAYPYIAGADKDNTTLWSFGSNLIGSLDVRMWLSTDAGNFVVATQEVARLTVETTGEISVLDNSIGYDTTGGLTFDASNNGTFSAKLDVTGNIDPTSYETTNGGFKDEDNMVSDSATAVCSQQSIKAYVDNQLTAEDLDFAGDAGTGAVDLDSQTFTIAGTANEIETSAASQTITIGLPASVTVATALTTPKTIIDGTSNFDITAGTGLQIQNQDGSSSSNVKLFSQDGDGTDSVHFIAYGVGTPGAQANTEYCLFGYDSVNTRFAVWTYENGTGTIRPLNLQTGDNTNQLLLATDGNVGINTATPDEKLMLYETTAETSVYMHIANDVTGGTASDGSLLGVNTNGELVINQLESESILIKTADTLALTIDSSQNATFEGNGILEKEIQMKSTGRTDLGAGGSAGTPSSDSVAGKSRIIIGPVTPNQDYYTFTGATDGQVLYVYNKDSSVAGIVTDPGGINVTVPAYEMVTIIWDSTLNSWLPAGQ